MLEVRDLRFTHPSGATVRADFSVPVGEAAAVMGASGAGKSTLLNLIAGFLAPDSGDIIFAGENLRALAPHRRPLTYLFQAHNLFPHLTVRQNLAIGLHPGMRLTAAQSAAVDRALDSVALCQFADRLPPSLSGGQQQRVALARCLARDRPLLLLDEPFTGLDETLRREMLTLLQSLNQTILLATHRRRDAEALGGTVIELS